MDAVLEIKRSPNWLLRIFIGVSAFAHFFILMNTIAPLRPQIPRAIELTLRETPALRRTIPRPPLRSQPPDAPKAAIREVERTAPIVPPAPVKTRPIQPVFPPARTTHVRAPDLKPADVPPLNVSEWGPEGLVEKSESKEPERPAAVVAAVKTSAPAAEIETAARELYFNTIRKLIERQKKYPRMAMLRKLEGKVVIEFELSHSGKVRSIRVAEGSRFDILNRAATRAVEAAAPYPKPPSDLFNGHILLRVPVVFELI